jgi:hypothetical protein
MSIDDIVAQIGFFRADIHANTWETISMSTRRCKLRSCQTKGRRVECLRSMISSIAWLELGTNRAKVDLSSCACNA